MRAPRAKVVGVFGIIAMSLASSCGGIATQALPTPTTQQLLDAESGRPVRISGGVMAGNILTKGQPIFPPMARAAHVNGAVVLRVVIGKDGSLKSAEAVAGPEMLRQSCVDTVRLWTYKPYLLNGEPVEVETTVTLNIQMNGGS